MSHKRNFWIFSILLFGIVLVAGCGNKNVSQETKNPIAIPKANEVSEKKTAQENLPAPTGNISDVVNAVNAEANGESDIISSEENDAQDAVADKEEADNFGAIYDENEF